MDTEPKYRNDSLLEVHLNGEAQNDYPPEHHPLNDDVPIDGMITLLYRDPEEPDSGRDEDGRWKAGTFYFRDHRKDDDPWAAFPEEDNFSQHPVWKWKNPEKDPHEHITLNPSIGLGQPLYLHCWIKQGEIEWL